jgi:hypothetical protein
MIEVYLLVTSSFHALNLVALCFIALVPDTKFAALFTAGH